MLASHLGSSARSSYISLKKTSNIDGTITGYPGIEAVFDEFGVLGDYIECFKSSKRPTLHIKLPTVYRILEKLDDVSHGKRVWRGEGLALAHLSTYSREFCRVIRERLVTNAWDHPLLLVGCYLNPLFREI